MHDLVGCGDQLQVVDYGDGAAGVDVFEADGPAVEDGFPGGAVGEGRGGGEDEPEPGPSWFVWPGWLG